MVGRTVGKYRIVEQIGRGGMGTVYAAMDETLDRRVAIKILNADLIDQDSVERFRREAMTLARLNHGKIGAIHELTRDGHDLLMVMEFLEGETFEKMIEHGPLPIPRAIFLCSQILDALQYAHAAGVVHRDLKPANIILTPSGDVKVMDFGIARVQGSEHLTTAGFMVGTPAYMAPEQVRGEEVDPRMDLYSLTVVLYRMLTQRLPFSGDTAIAMIHSQLNNPPTPPSQYRADLPDWLVKILDRGLSKAPADRFQTAKEFRVALESGLTGKLKMPTGVVRADVATASPSPASVNAPAPLSVNAPAPSGSAVAPRPLTGTLPSAAESVGHTGATSGTGAMPAAPSTDPSFEPAAPALPPAKTEKTVVLRAPQLATAGVLFALLVIGVGVLAFIALRRPTTPAPTDQAAVEIAPGSDSTNGAAPAPADIAASGSSAPAGGASTTPVNGASASAAKPGFPAPAASAGPATASASRGATPTPTVSSSARGATPSAAPATTAPAAAPVTAVPSPAASAPAAAPGRPPLPAAASAPAENFGDIRALVVDGGRSREVDALLSLEPGNLVVRSRSDGSVLRTLSYGSIGAATYARGRRPRGQSVADVVAVPDNGGSGFLGGARHWLTLQAPSEFLIVRLEDRNVIRVLNSIEARTGLKVQRNQSE